MQQASGQPFSSSGVNFPNMYQGTCQKVTSGAASVQSAAVGVRTTLLRIYATQDVHVKIGANPTAVADGTSMFLPKNWVDYIGCAPGDKVAVIQDSVGGLLFITEGA